MILLKVIAPSGLLQMCTQNLVLRTRRLSYSQNRSGASLMLSTEGSTVEAARIICGKMCYCHRAYLYLLTTQKTRGPFSS
jgi:hypothetical protein